MCENLILVALEIEGERSNPKKVSRPNFSLFSNVLVDIQGCDLSWEVKSVVKGEGVFSLRISNRRAGQFWVNISFEGART